MVVVPVRLAIIDLQLGEPIADDAEATTTDREAVLHGRSRGAYNRCVDRRGGVHGLLSGLVERLSDRGKDLGDSSEVHGRRSGDDVSVECLGRWGWMRVGGASRLRAERGDLDRKGFGTIKTTAVVQKLVLRASVRTLGL
jgi:hypothetical protein